MEAEEKVARRKFSNRMRLAGWKRLPGPGYNWEHSESGCIWEGGNWTPPEGVAWKACYKAGITPPVSVPSRQRFTLNLYPAQLEKLREACRKAGYKITAGKMAGAGNIQLLLDLCRGVEYDVGLNAIIIELPRRGSRDS